MHYTSKEQLITEFKKILLDKQTSQREVAHKLNITPQALTKIINKQNFSFDDMKKLLSAVNYRMDIRFVPIAGQPVTHHPTYAFEKNYKPFTAADSARINLHELLTNVRYQTEVAGSFGLDVLQTLMKKARQQEKQKPALETKDS